MTFNLYNLHGDALFLMHPRESSCYFSDTADVDLNKTTFFVIYRDEFAGPASRAQSSG